MELPEKVIEGMVNLDISKYKNEGAVTDKAVSTH